MLLLRQTTAIADWNTNKSQWDYTRRAILAQPIQRRASERQIDFPKGYKNE